MLLGRRFNVVVVATALLVTPFVLAAGCSAGGDAVEDDGNTNAGGASSSSATTGGGGQGAESPLPCAIDCSTIAAPDCQEAICNTTSKQCEIVPLADGTTCDDGAFCTVDDACVAGACVGGPQNTCGMTPPVCQEITCDETAQSCTTQPSANGTSCQPPGDLCISGASCTNGLCIGGAPTDCFFFPVPNECHVAVCNPNNGMCEAVPGNEGNPCVDAMDLCTINKACAAGVCSGGNAVDCSSLTFGCDLGVCDTTNGQCTTQAVMNGQTCDDFNGCTSGEVCTNGNCGGGTPITVCELNGDGCCPTTCNATNDLDCQVQPSCLAIKTSVPASTSGVYTIDPDGNGPAQQVQVYCDMNEDLGGWTLIARFANIDAANWMLDTGEWWYTKTTPAGMTTSRSDNADMISPAFWQVAATELRVSRTDNLNDAHLLKTTNSCLGNTNFRSFITAFGNYQNGALWPTSAGNAVAGTCPVTFSSNYASTNGFQYATCSATNIGAPNSISFWAAWSLGDGAVMMFGGGGNSCGRADHGIGVTEANSASFADMSAGEEDFGNNAQNYSDPYALNLWVR